MRHFRGKTGLRTLSLESRLLYSVYLMFSLAAYGVIGVLILQRTGLLPDAYAEHYLGNESEMVYAKSTAELLETTHFHLFSYPLFIMVQGHLFLMTSWPSRLKMALVMSCFAGCALYLASPWMVHFMGAGWAFLSLPARILLGVPLVLFVVVPLWELWVPAHPQPKAGTPED